MNIDIINIAHAGVITNAPSLASVGMKVLNFLLSVFEVVAIMMVVISGLKYFFSFGDETAMQSAKQAAKYSIIGIIMGLSGFILVRLVEQFLK